MFQSTIARGQAANAARGNPEQISDLIHQLDAKDGETRLKARRQLVSIGRPAVEPLMALLPNPNERLTWEVAKTLDQIGDPRSAAAFVRALEDPRGGISWLAAEGLIRLGRQGLRPLLEALAHHCESPWLRRGGHHVLSQLRGCLPDDVLEPIIRALEGAEPSLQVCVAAHNALRMPIGSVGPARAMNYEI